MIKRMPFISVRRHPEPSFVDLYFDYTSLTCTYCLLWRAAREANAEECFEPRLLKDLISDA